MLGSNGRRRLQLHPGSARAVWLSQGPGGVRVPNARALHSHFAFSDSPARRRLLYTAIWCLIKQDPLLRENERAV